MEKKFKTKESLIATFINIHRDKFRAVKNSLLIIATVVSLVYVLLYFEGTLKGKGYSLLLVILSISVIVAILIKPVMTIVRNIMSKLDEQIRTYLVMSKMPLTEEEARSVGIYNFADFALYMTCYSLYMHRGEIKRIVLPTYMQNRIKEDISKYLLEIPTVTDLRLINKFMLCLPHMTVEEGIDYYGVTRRLENFIIIDTLTFSYYNWYIKDKEALMKYLENLIEIGVSNECIEASRKCLKTKGIQVDLGRVNRENKED